MLAELGKALEMKLKNELQPMNGANKVVNMDSYEKVDLDQLIELNTRDELDTGRSSDLT